MIKQIVLTGGPCAGKTSAINKIKEEFLKEDFIVLSVDETATQLINMGITPYEDNLNMFEFQKYVFNAQLNKENLIDMFIKNTNKDVIVLYDRCILDNKTYVSENEFNELLNEFNIDENDYINKFDLFIYMQTAAIGTDKYNTETNSARAENKNEAIEKDDKIKSIYENFDKYVKVENDSDFDEKLNKVLDIIKHLVD